MPVGSGMRSATSSKIRKLHGSPEHEYHKDVDVRSTPSQCEHKPLKNPRGMKEGETALTLLPLPEERIFSGNMEKKSITSKGVHWSMRFAVLSREHLAFAKVLEECESQAGHWMSRIGEMSTNRLWEVFDKYNIKEKG